MADAKLIFKADEIESQPFDYAHPLDEGAEIRLFSLGYRAGLNRTGVSLGHLAPGKHSFPMHRHMVQEEWVYILSGDATLCMDDTETPVGPGDFAAFPAGGPAHKLTNTGNQTLVYLMGGDTSAVEIADFPELGKRLIFSGTGPDTRVEAMPLHSLSPVDMFSRVKTDG